MPGRQACMPCWDSTEQGGNRTLFYFAWLALPGTRLPQLAGWPRRRTRQPGTVVRPAESQAGLGLSGEREQVDLVSRDGRPAGR